MTQFDNPTIIRLRKELARVCGKMVKIAKQHDKGADYYDTNSPEYAGLAVIRDRICSDIRTEWNRERFTVSVAPQGSHRDRLRQNAHISCTKSGDSDRAL